MTISIIGVKLLVLFTGIAIRKSNYQEKQIRAGALRRLDKLLSMIKNALVHVRDKSASELV